MDNVNDSVPYYRPLDIPLGIPPGPIPQEPLPQTEEVDVHWIYNATIEEIRDTDGVFYVTASFQERENYVEGSIQSIVLIVSNQLTRLFDEDRRVILPHNLEVGMIIDALISSAMTMSLPPQATAFQILVVAAPLSRVVTSGAIVQVNLLNNFILIAPSENPDNILRINIAAETVILNPNGRRIQLNTLFPGMRIRVEHEQFMTSSIPPQTTGFVIHVLR